MYRLICRRRSAHAVRALFEKILAFFVLVPHQTVELSATQCLLKNSGVKCSKRILGAYLDDQGITFVDRGTGPGRRGKEKAKKQGRAHGGDGRGGIEGRGRGRERGKGKENGPGRGFSMSQW